MLKRLLFTVTKGQMKLLISSVNLCHADAGEAEATTAGEGGRGASRGPAECWLPEVPAVGSWWGWSPSQGQQRKSDQYVLQCVLFAYIYRCVPNFLFLLTSWPQTNAQAEHGGLQQPRSLGEESQSINDGITVWAPQPQSNYFRYCHHHFGMSLIPCLGLSKVNTGNCADLLVV